MYQTSISTHRFVTNLSVYHSFLSDDCCKLIQAAYDESEKINNSGYGKDNLINTERTDWHAHKNEKAFQVWKSIVDVFNDAFFRDMTGGRSIHLGAFLHESWIAVSTENSFVAPHDHGACPFMWSFSFYAKIPNKQSSINFGGAGSDNIKIPVREGDLLLFPSHLQHYSNDTVPERTIFSGNFWVKVEAIND